MNIVQRNATLLSSTLLTQNVFPFNMHKNNVLSKWTFKLVNHLAIFINILSKLFIFQIIIIYY